MDKFLKADTLPRLNHEEIDLQGLPGGAVGKNLPANAGDTGSIPGPGRSCLPWSS